jgi:hypothetical protein
MLFESMFAGSLTYYVTVRDAVVTMHMTRNRMCDSNDSESDIFKDFMEVTSNSSSISIKTPVPLPYSARSKAVLNSMISSRSGGISFSSVHISVGLNTEHFQVEPPYSAGCAINVAERLMALEYRDYEQVLNFVLISRSVINIFTHTGSPCKRDQKQPNDPINDLRTNSAHLSFNPHGLD